MELFVQDRERNRKQTGPAQPTRCPSGFPTAIHWQKQLRPAKTAVIQNNSLLGPYPPLPRRGIALREVSGHFTTENCWNARTRQATALVQSARYGYGQPKVPFRLSREAS